ncbi:MAG TPA: phage holin family protein [bacterium]|nr:phage holin family protein [bacterium]
MFLLRWILNALILLLVSYIVPGIYFSGTWSLLITVIIFGLINALVRPVLLLLTLPINILTLGLFTFIINALMFWLTSSIVRGFEVSNFWAAFWGALVYWLISTIISGFEKNDQ